jgi:hypothetical protein
MAPAEQPAGVARRPHHRPATAGQRGFRDAFAAPPALDELMRKLLVVHRLLEAEERLAKREPPTEPT